MTKRFMPRTGSGRLGATERGLYDTARVLPAPGNRKPGDTAIFDLPGAVVTTVRRQFRWGYPVILHTVMLQLRQAGASNTTVTLSKNGSIFDAPYNTLTLASGLIVIEMAVPAKWADYGARADAFEAQVTAAGTNAQDLTVYGYTWAMAA